MQEIFRTSQPAEIALVKSLLDGERIKYFVFDEGLIAGGRDMLTEVRFMVLEDEAERALKLIESAGLLEEEEYVDLMVTQDEALAEEAQQLLDNNDIRAVIEEDRPDAGLIAGASDAAVTYYLVVLETDYDAAGSVLEAAGYLDPLEPPDNIGPVGGNA